MEEPQQPAPGRRKTPKAATIGLLAAGAVIGGITASTLVASAAPSPSASPSTGTVEPGTAEASEAPHAPDRIGTSVRSDEKVLTGTDYDKAKAAALAAVPGATIYRIETDADGATYEAHLVKADGTEATVKMDKNFKVTATQAGHGSGGRHRGSGGPGDHDGDRGAPDGATSTASPAPSA